MTFLPFSATALWRSFLLCAFVTSVLPPARAQRTQAAAPAEIRRLLPAPSRFDLDAGASQILPISASGMAVCEVSVSVRPHTEDETASLSYQWSVSQKPEGAKVTIAQSRAASAKVSFSKPGAYFLRVDVSAEGWSDWQSVAVQVFDPVQTGFAMDRFKRPPEAGIHPRVFFNPEEVPALRDKLKNTACR